MTDRLLGDSVGREMTLWSPPGYALFLLPFRAMGFGPAGLRLLNAPLLATAVFLLYRLLRDHVSRRAAVAGAAAFAGYWPLWKMLPELMTETLAVCLMAALLLAWSRLRGERPRQGLWILLAGTFLAWLCLTRAIFGYALAVSLALFAAALLTRQRAYAARLLLSAAVALALCAPWLGYTASRTGKLFHWSSAGGMSLFWMTSTANPWGDWHTADEVALEPALAVHRPFFKRVATLPEHEQDEAFRQAALRNLARRPDVYARSLAANAGRLFFNTPYSFTPQKLSTLFFAVPNAFLLALLVLALTALAQRRDRLAAIAPALVLGGAALAGTLLLSAFGRMLLPLTPVFCLLIVVGLQDMRLTRPAAPESAP